MDGSLLLFNQIPDPHSSHHALSISWPDSAFVIHVFGFGDELLISAVLTKRWAECLIMKLEIFSKLEVPELWNKECVVHCPGPFSAINTIWDLSVILAVEFTVDFLLDIRHRFISLGGGIVYSWRPQLHFPIIVLDIVKIVKSEISQRTKKYT